MTERRGTAVPDLIGLILDLWGHLEWRHHGTGMLQAYAPGNEEVRIHVWHPALLLPGMAESGGMHNHRFTLRSTVVLGSILHDRLSVAPHVDGAYLLWRIGLGSKSADKDLSPYRQVAVRNHGTEQFQAGTTYELEKWAYHHARPCTDIAVTYVVLGDKETDTSASLLAPCGTVPVAAFSHNVNTPLIQSTLHRAHVALEYVHGRH